MKQPPRLFTILIAYTSFYGCSKTPSEPSPVDDFDLLKSAPTRIESIEDSWVPSPDEEYCVHETRTEESGDLTEMRVFRSIDNIVAGMIVDVPTDISVFPRPNPVDRTPITITINLPLETKIDTTIAQPSYSKIRSAINEILQQHPHIIPQADIRWDFFESFSESQIAIKLGLNFKLLGVKVKSMLSTDKKEGQRTINALFNQIAYDVDYELPPRQFDKWFPEDMAREQVVALLGDRAGVVSRVSYGRLIMIQMTSTFSDEEMTAAFRASWSSLTTSGDLKLDAHNEKVMRNSNIRALIIGGRAGSAVDIIELTLDNFKSSFFDIVKRDVNIEPNNQLVPMAYKIRWLSNYSDVKYFLRTEYRAPTCDINRQRVSVSIDSIKIIRPYEDSKDKPGEYYYRFTIAGRDGYFASDSLKFDVTRRCNEWVTGWVGDTIPVYEERSLSLPRRPGAGITLYGWIREKDKGCDDPDNGDINGKNDWIGKYNQVIGRHLFEDDWRPGSHKAAFLSGSKETADGWIDIYYTVEPK